MKKRKPYKITKRAKKNKEKLSASIATHKAERASNVKRAAIKAGGNKQHCLMCAKKLYNEERMVCGEVCRLKLEQLQTKFTNI